MIQRLRHYWAITVFTLFFLPLTIYLGLWQLERAEYKLQLQGTLTALEQPIRLTENQPISRLKDFQRVTLESAFIKPYLWLKDNQVVQGKVGYDAIGLVSIQASPNNSLLLVNRGWFASHGQRNPLPKVDWVSKSVALTGRLVPIHANPYQLGADIYTHRYPQLIQAIDLPQLAKQLNARIGGDLESRVLMLDTPGNATLIPHWKASTMTREKHLGYAWQWFGLALTLCLLYIYRVFISPSTTQKADE